MESYDDPNSFTDNDLEFELDRHIDGLISAPEPANIPRTGNSTPDIKYPFPNPPRPISTPNTPDSALPKPATTVRARRGYRDIEEIDRSLQRSIPGSSAGMGDGVRKRGRPRKDSGTDASTLDVTPKLKPPRTHSPDYQKGAEKVQALLSQLNPQFDSAAFEAVIKGLLHKPDGSAELKLLIPHEQIPNILCLAFASDLILTVQLHKKHN